MGREYEPVDGIKGEVVRELYVRTADDNYVSARWCYQQRLEVDFLWQAVHALEKYLKAVLLLNGRGTKQFSHDIVRLYQEVSDIASDLLPSDLIEPEDSNLVHWTKETPSEFLQRLYKYGNADNRYQLFGYAQESEDLMKVDAMVYVVRRLCMVHDAFFWHGALPRTNNDSNRDILLESPRWWRFPNGSLEKVIDGKRGEQLQSAALNCNLAFAPDDYEHQPLQQRFSARNPVLVRAILAPLKSELSPAVAIAVEALDWVLDNIKLPGEIRKELEAARPVDSD